MSAPRVLVVARREQRKGRPIQFVGEIHTRVLAELGALPVIAPGLEVMTDHAETLVGESDALLLVEGGDVGATYRSEDAGDVGLVELDSGKDRFEVALLEGALRRGLPILGICRGAQLLNVVRGGSLLRDIRAEVTGALTHLSRNDYDGHRHPVELEPGARLREIYDTDTLHVTSVHHQACDRLGDGLVAAGRSPDGLIEAIEDPAAEFIVGVQFHPERQIDEHPGHRALFAAFVAAASS